MNWFTKGYIGAQSAHDFVKKNLEEGSLCEHVEKDHGLAKYWVTENDSFGDDGKHIMCERCWEEMQEQEKNQEVQCHDCKGIFKQKDTEEYRWYGFYPNQGDEPLIICKQCLTKDKHVDRLNNDNEERRQDEMESDDWEQDGYDD